MTDVTRNKATFDYFGGLADLVVNRYKSCPVVYQFRESPGIKDAIEAMGIPHTEVDVILVNDRSVEFGYQLQHLDRVQVYPVNVDFSVISPTHLTPKTPANPKFILDVHLGKLARRMRLIGFDCLYKNDLEDSEIIQVSCDSGRIILTRDRGILKQKRVAQGYLVRSSRVEYQLKEVLSRYQLIAWVAPLTRCMACNGELRSVDKALILDRLEERTKRHYDLFHMCPDCERIYWEGSHFKNIHGWINDALV